jgi:hypothetical protein
MRFRCIFLPFFHWYHFCCYSNLQFEYHISVLLSYAVILICSNMLQYATSLEYIFSPCCRRFNVAVTRGMSLCVVVGHPYLLYSDHVWREFLEYCDINGTLLAIMLRPLGSILSLHFFGFLVCVFFVCVYCRILWACCILGTCIY